jgi:4,5-dihydroxyphthalate decarboxylase
MIPNEFEAGATALKTRGFYPINHTVVVRDEVLAKMPDVAPQLFEAFAESKRQYVADLKAGRISKPSRVDKVHMVALETMADPLPYGIAPNQKTLEGLIGHAATQKIIPGPIAIEDLFAKNVLNAVG